LFAATPNVSGMVVNPQTAMTCPPVRAAVQAIAETIGQLPVHVYRRSGDTKERDPNHPAYSLLHDAANDWTPATKLREEITRDALLDKGGFAEIVRIDDKPYELHRLEPSAVETSFHPITREPVYKVREGGAQRLIAWRNIIHIPSPCLPGRSIVQDARNTIGRALKLEEIGAAFFANGAQPSGLLISKTNVNEERRKNLSAAWKAGTTGKSAGGTPILEGDMTYVRLTMNLTDAQYIEACRLAIEDIARVFRIPPIFVGEYGRATWANSEEQGKQLLTYTLMPWIKRHEGEYALKLFNPDDRRAWFAEFLTDDLARADILKRFEAYSKAIAARILNPNEARGAENRAPYEGGDVFANPNITAGNSNE
jgi:HK97 family phage portal protein